jgi:hypothetical protein
VTSNDLLSAARAWLAAEPDDDIAAELSALIEDDHIELESRFAERLQFGTAGLRAAVGAGPMRMNRLVVRQAAASPNISCALSLMRQLVASSSATTLAVSPMSSPSTQLVFSLPVASGP